MKKKWIQDVMSQHFSLGTFLNPGRLIIVTGIMSRPLEKRISKKCIIEFFYRTYSDNLEMAIRNPNIMIRNLENYGLKDIALLVDEALLEWCSDAVNSILTYDNNWIYLNLDISDESIVSSTMQVVQMMYKKYFNSSVLYPMEIQNDDVDNDFDLDKFGCGIYKRRLLEDMQYCPICEETRHDKLVAVHIIPNDENEDMESRKFKENGLLMCRQHASEYNNGEFYFNEAGFVKNISSKTVDERMHLSFSVGTRQRKEFLKKRCCILKNNDCLK